MSEIDELAATIAQELRATLSQTDALADYLARAASREELFCLLEDFFTSVHHFQDYLSQKYCPQ